jgi:hypothetical protein
MMKILIAQGGYLINFEINKELISSWSGLVRLLKNVRLWSSDLSSGLVE